MPHMYRALICKTSGCGKEVWRSHVGDFPNGTPIVVSPPLGVFDLRCDRCDKVYDYEASELYFFAGPAPDSGRM